MSLPIATQTARVKPRYDSLGLGETVHVFDVEDRSGWGEFHYLVESRPCPVCGCNRVDVHGQSLPGIARGECAACERIVFED